MLRLPCREGPSVDDSVTRVDCVMIVCVHVCGVGWAISSVCKFVCLCVSLRSEWLPTPKSTDMWSVQVPRRSHVYTPWAIKKRATFIFSITLANIDGFS